MMVNVASGNCGCGCRVSQAAEAEAVMAGHDACWWIQHYSTVSRALGCGRVSATTSFSTLTLEEPASTIIS